MSLDIGAAVRDGFRRSTRRNALVLLVALLGIGFASAVVSQSFNAALMDAAERLAEQQGQDPSTALPTGETPTPLALPLSLPVAAGLFFLLALVSEYYSIVAVRTFVSEETRTIPREFLRRNAVAAVVNGFVGGVVVAVLVVLGLVALVLPGVFLYVSFFFVRQEIAVEDVNFVDAMADSWQRSKGNRVELFALALLLLVVALVANAPALLPVLPPVGTAVVGVVVSAAVGVFSAAVTSRAYAQLREDDEEGDDGETGDEPDEADEDPYEGALGPDDLPEP